MKTYERATAQSGPWIDAGLCTLCGWCIEMCPQKALAMGAYGPILSQPERCNACGTCEENCPEGAVEVAFAIVGKDAQTLKEDG